MKRPAHYHTKQRDAIVSYLSSLEGAHVTAGRIAAYFKEQGIRVGLTTIYRQLDKLVQEGVVAKYTVDGVNSACYQYTDEDSDADKDHYHLKCEMCGDLIHLQCDHVATLSRHFFEKHLFALDSQKTLFYGTCNQCYAQRHEPSMC
ncbi:MAG: Fur family transcriptional regulator [Christensenellales bacterium]|jgi:Fur family ferric uptake transcriptional regulator